MKFLRYLRHLLVPHQGNNHRAKILHLDSLFSYVLLLLVFNLGIRVIARNYPNVLGYATDIRVETLLTETNSRREALGLTPLTLNRELSFAAASKAQDMFSNNYWAHNSPLGKTPWDFIVANGYKYTLAGENLAKNFSYSKDVVDAWMNSPSHRDNLVKPGYRDIGFAVVNGILNGEETTLVVQMFGTSSVAPIAQQYKVPALTEAASQAEYPIPELAKPENPLQATIRSAFTEIKNSPVVNLPTLTRDVVFLFSGILLGVLVVDALVSRRRHVVRLTGHNAAHILFLLALLIGIGSLSRGVLL